MLRASNLLTLLTPTPLFATQTYSAIKEYALRVRTSGQDDRAHQHAVLVDDRHRARRVVGDPNPWRRRKSSRWERLRPGWWKATTPVCANFSSAPLPWPSTADPDRTRRQTVHGVRRRLRVAYFNRERIQIGWIRGPRTMPAHYASTRPAIARPAATTLCSRIYRGVSDRGAIPRVPQELTPTVWSRQKCPLGDPLHRSAVSP
jgi:hypothetical protein